MKHTVHVSMGEIVRENSYEPENLVGERENQGKEWATIHGSCKCRSTMGVGWELGGLDGSHPEWVNHLEPKATGPGTKGLTNSSRAEVGVVTISDYQFIYLSASFTESAE